MTTNVQQEKIKDVLAECEMHWIVNRIPDERVQEMSAELEQHLREAARDGKTIDAVVGPDAFAFAESWAEEDRPSWSVIDRVVEYAWALSLQAVFFAVVFHLFMWALFLPVHWWVILYLLLISLLLSRAMIKPKPANDHPRWRKWLFPAVAALLVAVVWFWREDLRPLVDEVDVAITGNADGTLLVWPWYATLVAVGLNYALGRLRK